MSPNADSNTGQLTATHPIVPIIKEFRKEIDANIQKAARLLSEQVLGPNYGRELALVRTKLEEAKMWAGKVLEAVGNPFPAELADKANVQ